MRHRGAGAELAAFYAADYACHMHTATELARSDFILQPAAIIAAGLVLFLLFVAGLVLGLRLGRRSGNAEAQRGFDKRLAREREDAVKRSRAVIGGQMSEQIAPYLPGFPFDPSELRFIGKPVDFVAFKGASLGEIEEVVFVEVKSGSAGLSRVERSLREAVEEKRVRWLQWRAP